MSKKGKEPIIIINWKLAWIAIILFTILFSIGAYLLIKYKI